MYINRIQSSLKAEFGNLTKEVPLLYIQILQGFLNHLEKFIGEAIDEDT